MVELVNLIKQAISEGDVLSD